MATIFTRIISGEIPAFKVAEDELFLSFLDIRPIAIGHTLVIPKQEVDYIFDLDDDLLAGLNVFAKKVAHAMSKTIPCKRIGSMVIGLEVPHAHLHLVPLKTERDILITNPRLNLPAVEMQHIAAAIASNMEY